MFSVNSCLCSYRDPQNRENEKVKKKGFGANWSLPSSHCSGHWNLSMYLCGL